jgi:hypothetical protein
MFLSITVLGQVIYLLKSFKLWFYGKHSGSFWSATNYGFTSLLPCNEETDDFIHNSQRPVKDRNCIESN